MNSSTRPSFLPKAAVGEIEALMESPDVTVIDARLPQDFRAGHLGGAINVPVGSDAGVCSKLLLGVPKSNRLLLYCQSYACPFAATVAKVLEASGYRNVILFREGWVGWQEHQKDQLR